MRKTLLKQISYYNKRNEKSESSMNPFAEKFLNQPKEWRAKYRCDPGMVMSREVSKDEIKQMFSWLQENFSGDYEVVGDMATMLWKSRPDLKGVYDHLSEDDKENIFMFKRDINTFRVKNYEAHFVVKLKHDHDRLAFKLVWG